jgi:LysM repeat protein
MFLGQRIFAQNFQWQSFDYSKFPWIDSTVNIIQTHNKELLNPLMNKLKKSQKKKVHILHIGDSHVQADIFTHEARSLLGTTFGYAGRGMVFPYTTARTHTAADYRSRHSGKWYYARNVEKMPELPLGVSGITSRTYDNQAQFTLSFREGAIKPEFNRIRLFVERSPRSYDIKVIAGPDTVYVDIYQTPADSLTDEIWIDMPRGRDEYTIEVVQNDSTQEYFEVYGLSFETREDKGLLYTSVGINGAGHYSIMRENKLPQHLQSLNPDAIILDVGANDFYQKGMDQNRFKDNLISIIELFKSYAPDALIILSNSQDIHRGGFSIRACSVFSNMISEVSKTENVSFYDWYRIAGGNQSMKIWKSLHLANKDGVHLTRNGYELKGTLIYQAFSRTFQYYFEPKHKDKSFIIPCLDPIQIDSIEKVEIASSVKDKIWQTHWVKKGETAWGIAQLYNVSVIQLKDWNRLGSYSLREGQELKIHSEIVPAEEPPKKTANESDKKSIKKGREARKEVKKTHVIQQGETLYSIARKHKMSVNELKQLNGMKDDFIHTGKKLKVK